MLRRKINDILREWKNRDGHKPLIVKGARQVGKTASIRLFAHENYKHVVEINFALDKKYRGIFDSGYDVDSIVKNITMIDPRITVEEGNTLFFFDELQDLPNCATSLKSFRMDGRYDVICSGSQMGINYNQIESNAVGYKEDYEMHSMDFEEFLWAKGYKQTQIDDLYAHMAEVRPFGKTEMEVMLELFRDYMVTGGMPEVVNTYIVNGNFSGILEMQRQLHADYEEDITKYATGVEKGKVLSVYRHISSFLSKENKKFQVTKIAHGARNREYMGSIEWLKNAGIINVCYCLDNVELPLKGNYDPRNYKIYYKDTGMLIASLDDEAQEDLRVNRNLGTYKGALYENIVADMLVKQGYALYYYRNDASTLEMDFFVRNTDSLIPVEVKAGTNASSSLNRLTHDGGKGKYGDIRFGIKFTAGNIGFNGQYYTFPYFLAFLLKRFLREQQPCEKATLR